MGLRCVGNPTKRTLKGSTCQIGRWYPDATRNSQQRGQIDTELTLSRLQLQSEGPVSRNSAYASAADLRTGGGYLESNPIARFKTEHRSEDVRFLISQLALNKGVYNIELDIPGVYGR